MSIKVRAYPGSPELTDALLTHLGQARFVFNIGLEQRRACDKRSRDRGVRVSFATQSRELTDARKEFDWLGAGSTVVQQGALRDLDRAFANFFAGRARFPKFRKKTDRQSFVIRDVRLRRYNKRWAAILVPKAGWLRFKLTRSWPEVLAATGARVCYDHGRWHISLTTPAPVKRDTPGGQMIGLDRGVAVTVMTSDAEALQAPGFTEAEKRRFEKLECRLSRQKNKSSRRREATKAKMAGLRRRLSDRRNDWVEKSTTLLAQTYTFAAVENLNIAAMVKRPAPKPDGDGGYLPNGAAAKTGLARAIHAQLWGRFVRRLGDKMEIFWVDPRFTSQKCNRCGHAEPGNRKSQAVFSCLRCGHTADADVNAACNLRDAAIENYGRGTHGDRTSGLPAVNLQVA